jgi:hypothetical protein
MDNINNPDAVFLEIFSLLLNNTKLLQKLNHNSADRGLTIINTSAQQIYHSFNPLPQKFHEMLPAMARICSVSSEIFNREIFVFWEEIDESIALNYIFGYYSSFDFLQDPGFFYLLLPKLSDSTGFVLCELLYRSICRHPNQFGQEIGKHIKFLIENYPQTGQDYVQDLFQILMNRWTIFGLKTVNFKDFGISNDKFQEVYEYALKHLPTQPDASIDLLSNFQNKEVFAILTGLSLSGDFNGYSSKISTILQQMRNKIES